jgi:hypothetical protein
MKGGGPPNAGFAVLGRAFPVQGEPNSLFGGGDVWLGFGQAIVP